MHIISPMEYKLLTGAVHMHIVSAKEYKSLSGVDVGHNDPLMVEQSPRYTDGPFMLEQGTTDADRRVRNSAVRA